MMTNEIFESSQTAEEAVIGSLLLDHEKIKEAKKILSQNDFGVSVYGEIYNEIVKSYDEGKIPDYVLLTSKGFDKRLLLHTMEVTQTTANIKEYATEVRRGAIKRALYALTEDISGDLIVGESSEQIIEKVKGFTESFKPVGAVAAVSSKDAIFKFMNYRRDVDKRGTQAVPSYLKPLDETVGTGFVNSGFYIVAARPSVGKTTFAIALADNMASRNHKVLFYSLEMSIEQMTARRMGRRASISYNRLMLGKLDLDDYKKLNLVGKELADTPLYIRSGTKLSVKDLESEIISLEPDIVFVDYIGLMSPIVSKKNRYEEMTDISNDLKRLAMKYKIPIVCLAQLNRENMKSADKRPTMANLRDSGAIEQDADGVILLHRPKYYELKGDNKDNEGENKFPDGAEVLEVIVDKNRHGSVGSFPVKWYGATGIMKAMYSKEGRWTV